MKSGFIDRWSSLALIFLFLITLPRNKPQIAGRFKSTFIFENFLW